ncbi:MAG: heat-shock protein [Bacteroidetes bacterium SW_9_63_38]|nr:MAG: heat-shock protein [Bacteroidetes bacterium SW_9_63_38]
MTSLSRTRNRGLNDLQREIDRMFDRFLPSESQDNGDSSRQAVWAPRTDLVETEDAYRMHLDLPGVQKDDLTINYQDHQLTISGERASPQTGENEEYVRVERPFGHFYRSFPLPRTVNAEQIGASYESGVLTIHVPKTDAVKPRQIEIQ